LTESQDRGASVENAIELSIVVPVFNEAESIPELCDGLGGQLDELSQTSEILFVDDGSTDDTYVVLEEMSRKHSRVRAIRFQRNNRKAAALAAGFSAARGGIIITMDGDLQDDPAEIRNLLTALEAGSDLVSGWKKERHDPLSKTLPSKLFNLVTSLVSGIRLHDFNCGLKAYRSEVAKDLLPYLYGELYRYIPAIAHWSGYRVSEIPVNHRRRQYGKSKFGSRRLINGLLDLLSITFVVRFMTTPMHVFGSLGMMCGLAGTAIGGYITFLWLQTGSIQNRHPLLILCVLLIIVGIQLFSTGLLGDMLASVHQRSGRAPRVSNRCGD
jgi:glycosyltransferase involved in cell wall biosynthesis